MTTQTHTIRHRFTGAVLYTAECDTFSEAVTLAVRENASLRHADLWNASLRHANLENANLENANLRYADLENANLENANLRYADLENANLWNANLENANLRHADLRYASLRYADLENANLDPLVSARLTITPTGAFEAWKKCRNDVLVRLRIPAEAKRSNAMGRKCRAEYAEVLEVYGADTAYSLYDNRFAYRVGETVHCDNWDEDRWNECSGGIHFFITKEEAEDWA